MRASSLSPVRRAATVGTIVLAGAVRSAEEAVGAGAAGGGEWTRAVFRELFASRIHELALSAVSWVLLGAVLGAAAAVALILVTRKTRCWRSGWRFAGWVRWPLWTSMVVLTSGFLALAGFWKGVASGGEQVLRKSQLATGVFPLAGDALADALVSLQTRLESDQTDAGTNGVAAARLEDFKAGRHEFDAARFSGQIDHLRDGAVSNILRHAELRAAEATPLLADGLGRVVLGLGLRTLGGALVGDDMDTGLRRFGLAGLQEALREDLPALAKKTGHPDTVTRPELSAFLVQEAVVPVLLLPVRTFVKTNIWLNVILAGASLLLPIVFFRCTCGLVKAPVRHEAPPSPVV